MTFLIIYDNIFEVLSNHTAVDSRCRLTGIRTTAYRGKVISSMILRLSVYVQRGFLYLYTNRVGVSLLDLERLLRAVER